MSDIAMVGLIDCPCLVCAYVRAKKSVEKQDSSAELFRKEMNLRDAEMWGRMQIKGAIASRPYPFVVVDRVPPRAASASTSKYHPGRLPRSTSVVLLIWLMC